MYDKMQALIQNEAIFVNIILTVIAFIIIFVMRWLGIRRIKKKNVDQIKQFAIKKLINSICLGVLVIVFLVIWYESSSYIIAVLGVFSAGIAFAIRDILLDMIGWVYILWAAPFKIGDRIQIGEEIGDVIDVGLVHFSMLEVDRHHVGGQSTGRIMQIPNLQVFSLPLKNYEKGFKFIWHEVNVDIDATSDWGKAKEMLYGLLEECTEKVRQEAKEQIQEAGKNYAIYYRNLTPIIYTKMQQGKIQFALRFMCEPRKVRDTEHLLWEGILKMVKQEEDIRLG